MGDCQEWAILELNCVIRGKNYRSNAAFQKRHGFAQFLSSTLFAVSSQAPCSPFFICIASMAFFA